MRKRTDHIIIRVKPEEKKAFKKVAELTSIKEARFVGMSTLLLRYMLKMIAEYKVKEKDGN